MQKMKAEDIRSVACVGGGTIGFSWAVLFAQHGMRVTIYDVSECGPKPSLMPSCAAPMPPSSKPGVMTAGRRGGCPRSHHHDHRPGSSGRRCRLRARIRSRALPHQARDLPRPGPAGSSRYCARLQHKRHANDGDSIGDHPPRALRRRAPIQPAAYRALCRDRARRSDIGRRPLRWRGILWRLWAGRRWWRTKNAAAISSTTCRRCSIAKRCGWSETASRR